MRHVLVALAPLALIGAAATPSYPVAAIEAFARGHAAAAEHDCPKAIEWWNEAIRRAPGYWEAHMALTECLVPAERFTEAVTHLEAVLRLNARYAPATTLLADLAAKKAASGTVTSTHVTSGFPPTDAKHPVVGFVLAYSGPGEKLWLIPPEDQRSLEFGQHMHAGEPSGASGDYILRGDEVTPVSDPFTDTQGNMYQKFLARDGSHVLLGRNAHTNHEWINVYRPDGTRIGRDDQGRDWRYDPKTTIYKRSDGVTCVGEAALHDCSPGR